MQNISIRKATASDAPVISLLARVTFTETFAQDFDNKQDLLEYYDKTFSVEKITKSIVNENNVFWMAFYDNLPVGYAKLKKHSTSEFINSHATSQLQKIYVLSDFLHKKIGHLLQNEMFKETKFLGSKFLWLSVLKSNERAISFYIKSNFTAIGEHTFDIGKTHFEFMAFKKDF